VEEAEAEAEAGCSDMLVEPADLVVVVVVVLVDSVEAAEAATEVVV